MRSTPLLACLLLAACAPTAEPGQEDGPQLVALEEDNRAPELDPADGEALELTSGFDAANLQYWTHMRALVAAEPDAIWEALRTPEVMADRRVLVDWEVVDEGHVPEVDFSFAIDNEMSIEFANIGFELTWLHEEQASTEAGPTFVMARWDKTAGPPFIDKLSGSLEIESIGPGLSELRGISHLRSVRRDTGAMEQYWTDLHDEIAALLAGDPLPVYDAP